AAVQIHIDHIGVIDGRGKKFGLAAKMGVAASPRRAYRAACSATWAWEELCTIGQDNGKRRVGIGALNLVIAARPDVGHSQGHITAETLLHFKAVIEYGGSVGIGLDTTGAPALH